MKGWKTDKPGLALPDESYSLRDLYQKYSIGTTQALSHARDAFYDHPDAPLEAPLAPERLNIQDVVDTQEQIAKINAYVEDTMATVDAKTQKALKDHETATKKANKKNDATTTNDDATKSEATET